MRAIKGAVIAATLALGISGCASTSTTAIAPGRVISCDSMGNSKLGKGLVLPCLDGKSSHDISGVKGPLIINVWGSWCAPCKDEIPIFRNFYEKNKEKVQILGVDVEEANISDGKEFVIAEGITWPNLFDKDGRSRAYFGMGVPVTWFVNSKGEVVFKKIGVLKDENELRDLTAQYLEIDVS